MKKPATSCPVRVSIADYSRLLFHPIAPGGGVAGAPAKLSLWRTQREAEGKSSQALRAKAIFC